MPSAQVPPRRLTSPFDQPPIVDSPPAVSSAPSVPDSTIRRIRRQVEIDRLRRELSEVQESVEAHSGHNSSTQQPIVQDDEVVDDAPASSMPPT